MRLLDSFVDDSGQQSGQQNKKLNSYKEMVLEYCLVPRTAKDIRDYLPLKSRQYISTYIIKPFIDTGMLDYTNKKSINARNQKYVTIRRD